jgi:hypothetical protein
MLNTDLMHPAYNSPVPPLLRESELEHYERILARLDPDYAHLVEFGCGGSTVWLASQLRNHQYLDSIEHNPAWFDMIDAHVRNCRNVHLHLHPPDLPLTQYKYANPEEEMPAGLTGYLNPGIHWADVSLVFVDGIARGAVLATLPLRVAKGTTVLLHDYDGREAWYDWALSTYTRVSLTESLLELHV